MEPTNQAPVQTPTQTKSNKKFIIPIIALSIITAALAGFIIYDQFIKTSNNTDAAQDKNTSQDQPSGNDTSGTTTPENDSGEALDADQFAKDKADLYPNGALDDYYYNAINARYPAYNFITGIITSYGHAIIEKNGYTDAQQLFRDIATTNGTALLYMFGAIYGSYSSINATEADANITSVFGTTDVRTILTQFGYTYKDSFYTYQPSGLGGACEPQQFLSSITQTGTSMVLTYSYANPPTACDSSDGKITHQIIVTIANNGTNRIQKIDVNPVGQ